MPSFRSISVGGSSRDPVVSTSQPGTPTKRASSVGFAAPPPGTPKRKGAVGGSRGASLGASLSRLGGSLVVRGATSAAHAQPLLRVVVNSISDTKVSVKLPGVKLETGGDLDAHAGKQGSMTYTASGPYRSNSS